MQEHISSAGIDNAAPSHAVSETPAPEQAAVMDHVSDPSSMDVDENSSQAEPAAEPVKEKAVSAEPDSDTPPDDASRDEGEEKPQLPRSAQRIQELTTQRKEALAEAEYWRQKATSLAEKSDVSEDLDPLDFESDADYQRAIVQAAVMQSQQLTAQTQAEAAKQRSQLVAEEAFLERQNDIRSRISDYDTVVQSAPPISLQSEVVEALIHSEKGPEMQYYLAKNFGEAQRINSLPPQQALMELGRLEGRLTTAQPKRVSAAPKPPPTVSGNNTTGSKDPEDMSMAEYIRWRGHA